MKTNKLLLFAFVFILLQSCGKKIDNSPTNTTKLKPQAAGLTIRSFEYIANNPQTDIELLRITNCIVVRVLWRDIQPTENGAILRPNTIDDAINFVRQKNSTYPGINISLKIRVLCGVASPAWVKEKCGSFTLFTDLLTNSSGPQDSLMPKFWQPEFMSAYASLQNKLASIYDTIPEIREIVNGGTGALYAESFIRFAGNAGITKQNSINYINAGWSADKDLEAIKNSIDVMKAWKKTRVSMAFNEFIQIEQPPNVYRQTAPTKTMIDYFLSTLGNQAVLGNNGLRDDNAQGGEDWIPGGLMYEISEYMKTKHTTLGIPVYYQTATIDKLSNLKTTIEKGIEKGAGAIELPGPPQVFSNYVSIAELNNYDSQTEAQAAIWKKE